MHPIYNLLLKLQSANLGHEAVIEIMLAVLGLMIAILTLISGLLAIGIAVVGWFGYTTIRDEAGKRAEQAASKIAQDVAREMATKVAKAHIRRLVKGDEASALIAALSQEPLRNVATKVPRKKATSDSSLRKDDV